MTSEIAGAVADPRRLHIVIDGRELVGRPTGVGRYVMSVLTQWATGKTGHRFTVIVPGAVPAELAALAPTIHVHQVSATSIGTIFEQFRLPGIVTSLAPDVFFAPAYTAPLRRTCPTVLLIHDLAYFAHPEWFRWREGLRRRWITRWAAANAAALLTVSHVSAHEISAFLNHPEAGIGIAPGGAPDVDVAVDDTPRAPIVLYVGSIFARRRIPELIGAFADVVKHVPAARLVLVGDNRSTPPVDPNALAAAAGLATQVDWRRYVSDDELHALYGTARVFAFLSDYEGFAMTPAEAIAKGVPAVMLDTPIAREVYGDGALRVGPTTRELSAALITLLTDDRAHEAQLAQGRAQLSTLSWQRTADVILTALTKAAAARSGDQP